jgi:hypothetical protein
MQQAQRPIFYFFFPAAATAAEFFTAFEAQLHGDSTLKTLQNAQETTPKTSMLRLRVKKR